ncbi:hypothetical protein V8C40DRAFT_15938 [Trichoderma camerunense]
MARSCQWRDGRGGSPEPLNVRAEEAPHGVCRQFIGAIAQSLAGRGTLWAQKKMVGWDGINRGLMDMRWDVLAPNSGSSSRTHELVLWATPPLRPANAPKKKPTSAVATRPWCAGRALETAGTCAKSGDEGCLVAVEHWKGWALSSDLAGVCLVSSRCFLGEHSAQRAFWPGWRVSSCRLRLKAVIIRENGLCCQRGQGGPRRSGPERADQCPS